MARKSQPFSFEQTPEQRAVQARWDRLQRRRNELGCRLLQCWDACVRPGCRRKRACAGDPEACFTRHWAMVPEDRKEYLRGWIKAAATTRDPGERERAACAAREAYLKAMATPLSGGVPTEAAPEPEPDVRIRRL